VAQGKSEGVSFWRSARRPLACFAIAVLSTAAGWSLCGSQLFQSFRLKALDFHFLVRPNRPAKNIVLLAIDQKSLDTLPEPYLFWHRYYAEAIRAAAAGGAKVLGLDVTFMIPVQTWEPTYDQILAGAVSETSPVMPAICGYVPAAMQKQNDWPVPVNMAASALGLFGFVNLTVDADDFVRRQELFASAAGQDPVRSMALRVAEKFLGAEAQFGDGKLSLAGKPVPLADDRSIRINYAGPADTFPRISFSDFLDAARAGKQDQIRRWVQGKAVLVGMDNIADRYPTPFFTLFKGSQWNTSGVEIHANTLRTLLDRDFLVPAPTWLQIALVFGVALLAASLSVCVRFSRAFITLTLLVAGALTVTQVAFGAGLLLPTLEIVIASALCLGGASTYRFFMAEKHRDFLRKAVQVFVGEHVAKSLDSTGRISMSGTRQVVTILFSDIRGFTAFCDKKDPATVVDLLNEYLSGMVAIIHFNGGYVNKFIGDGIMAIFSDEDSDGLEDHAVRAVRCGMQMAMVKGQFKTGVGIHTGPVVVGNIGSEEKCEYTALGDTVNLASRLESLNKEQKTQLLMSEATWERAKGSIETALQGTVEVRGSSVPMKLYTAAGLAHSKPVPVPSTVSVN
jgi:adenylate cyclase